jgi:amino acid transporter
MKPTIVILILLTYVFVTLPFEITDIFLAYLIPFCISIGGLIISVLNFRPIRKIEGKYRLVLKVANIITIIVFLFLTVFNFPIPERSGLRCKNWTDIEMVINPTDSFEQYVFQSFELSGSIYSHRKAKVKPVNSWLRWHHEIKEMPQSGKWLYIDNSKGGENAVPFPLDNSKINYENDKSKAIIVTIENGQIKNNP